MNCKSFLTTVASLAVLAFTFGCTPPEKDVDTSTDTGAETSTDGGTSSNVTESIETPDNNTTTGSETPEGETP
jgi:hypothetical protein